MSQPMIVWCAIAGLLLLTFMFRAFEQYFTKRHHHHTKMSSHVIEIGKDKEMFFVPGDFDEDDDFE